MKERKKERKSFTLIELIIVVVIIGILALVAIPRYFANVAKAQKSQVYANLDAIRQAELSYYAVYGAWPAASTWPITVTIDGDTIVSLGNMSNTAWTYYNAPTVICTPRGVWAAYAYKQPGNTCQYALCTDGYAYGSCTP
ncbi:MAG: prepilin-type N-terminal cleavage/methylation domain-containing protein [Candidatus Omnitrophota bacterium]|jgi:prepilin-type N-terminal cleavage/methylation domain-containing protein